MKKLFVMIFVFTLLLSSRIWGADSALVPQEKLEVLRGYMPAPNYDESIYCTISSDATCVMADSKYYEYVEVAPTNENEYPSYYVKPLRMVQVLPIGYAAKVLGNEHGWVFIEANGKKGYVEDCYVDFQKGNKPDTTSLMTQNKGLMAINYGANFIGTPYLWGGNDLKTGVDCSGFVTQVYKYLGINLSRNSSAMYENNGTAITSEELKAGDLLFFNTSGKGISHVAIYIGNGKYIQSTDGKGICVEDFYGGFEQATFVGAKRVVY